MPDQELEALLNAKALQDQKSWSYRAYNIFLSLVVYVLIINIKLIFYTRDIITVALNLILTCLIFPFDLILVLLHSIITHCRTIKMLRTQIHDAKKQPIHQEDFLDLNSTRKLFWLGSRISTGKCFSTLKVPEKLTCEHGDNDAHRHNDERISPIVSSGWKSVMSSRKRKPLDVKPNKKKQKKIKSHNAKINFLENQNKKNGFVQFIDIIKSFIWPVKIKQPELNQETATLEVNIPQCDERNISLNLSDDNIHFVNENIEEDIDISDSNYDSIHNGRPASENAYEGDVDTVYSIINSYNINRNTLNSTRDRNHLTSNNYSEFGSGSQFNDSLSSYGAPLTTSIVDDDDDENENENENDYISTDESLTPEAKNSRTKRFFRNHYRSLNNPIIGSIHQPSNVQQQQQQALINNIGVEIADLGNPTPPSVWRNYYKRTRLRSRSKMDRQIPEPMDESGDP